MKYKYGDIVCCRWESTDDDAPISMLAEEDLKDCDDKDKDYVKEIKEIHKGISPPNKETRYFNVYDVTETGYRKIRGSFSRRKEGEIPVRK